MGTLARRNASLLTVALCTCAVLAPVGCKPRSKPPVARSIHDAHPLLGKPAPAFQTVDDDGRPIDFKSRLGKDVIMLDFWATWCGPCILAMPEVASAAKRFEGRDFTFYAVNVGEDPDTVKEFLEELKLDVPVAMDFKGTIEKSYESLGLPHTVLIGKDGKVQAVHIGYRPDMAEELASHIEQLLAGKDLASEALGESKRAD